MKKFKIVWSSAHNPTDQQVREMVEWAERSEDVLGVVLLKNVSPKIFREITSLQKDSPRADIAKTLVRMAKENNWILVQPAGDPRFHMELGIEAHSQKFQDIHFAFSKRESKDIPQEDGTVKKVSTFKFEGWI